ncbi:MAG: murein biosynthesis integral membrane protein MurJ [Chloroflexi bacterium]|nr:MAG: murein biosynthesis integral membrane protein MurJ [Chloroflexota bacterium]
MNESTMIATATIVEPQLEESTALTPNEGPSKHRIPVFNKTFSFNLRSFLPGGDDFSLRRFSIIEAAMLLIMGYLASKGLGVVRQTIFNALFGTGMQANAYYAASRLPDTLFDLIAGGALTHAFIPIFLSYEKDRGQREAWRLASLVFNVLLVALTALVIVSEFVAPAFVSRLLVPGYPPAQQALTAALTRVMLIQPLILGLGTVVTAILNSKRQFFLPALSLAIYNVGLIGGLLFSLAIPRIGIYGPTYGVLAAAALQVLVMVPALVKQGVRYTFIWDLRNPGLRQVMRLLIPNALAVAIASTGFIVDTAFISYLPDQASLAAERNAHMLYALPLALLGLAIGQAALPQLSSLAASGRYVRLRMTVVKLIGGSLSLSLIASLMMYLLGKPAIRLLFQHGAFGKHSSAVTGTALLGYAFALPAVIAASLLVLSFYALKDARTPLLINILGLATRWSLIILLLRLLTGSHMILAIPLAAGGVGIVESLVLGSLLFIRLRSKVKTDKGMLRLERRRGQHAKTSAEQQEHEDGISEQSIKGPGESRIGLKGPEESEETFT